MGLQHCVECGGQVSDKAPTCPHCGAPINSAPRVAECQYCRVAMVQVVRRPAVSLAGLAGIVIVLIGLGVAVFVSLLAGLFTIVLGIIVSTVLRGKKTVMACPKCGATGARLA